MAKTKQTGPITFTIESNILASAIGQVGTAVGTNPLLPIMEDVRITLADTTMTVEATDLKVWRVDKVTLLTGVNTDFTLPYKALKSLLETLSPQPITITLETVDVMAGAGAAPMRATIKYKGGRQVMPANNGADYPTFDPGESGNLDDIFTFKASDLAGAISHTTWAQETDNDDLRIWKMCHMVVLDQTQIRVYACDGNNMATAALPAESKNKESLLIQKTSTRALLGFLKGKDQVSAQFSKRAILFNAGESIFGCIRPEDPMNEEKFLSIIPSNQDIVFQVSAAETISALRRVTIAANDSANGRYGNMELHGATHKMRFIGSQVDYGRESEEEVEIMPQQIAEGLEFKSGMNFTSFMAAIAAAGSIQDNLTIKFVTPERPYIIYPTSRPDCWSMVIPLMNQ